MRMYTIFKHGRNQEPERLDFEAEDSARAFTIAQRESGNEPIELWEGTKRLARLTRMGGDVWQID